MGVEGKELKAFSQFKCIGGECLTNCCIGWGVIPWEPDEVRRLMEQDFSPELTEFIKTSFGQRQDGLYCIKEVNGKCPFLDERQYCRIQLEKGHELLGHTCQHYPRKFVLSNGVLYNALHCSCGEVVRMLINDQDAARLVTRTVKVPQNVNFVENSKTFLAKPELKYRKEIFTLLYDVIYDSSYSVETGIVLGALAMQKISEYAEKKQAERIPEVIRAIKPQLRNAAQIEKLEQMKPNYGLKFAMIEPLMSEHAVAKFLHNEDGSCSVEKYNVGEQKFAECFADREYAMRNLFVNLLLDLNMPCFSKSHTFYENYCYFVFCVSAFKYLAAIIGYSSNNIELGFTRIVAKASRKYCHSTKNIDVVLEKMKQLNCTSPAYLASLIK